MSGDPSQRFLAARAAGDRQPNGSGAAPGLDAAQELREVQAFLERVPVAVHCVGEDGTIMWANASQLALLGYAREEYIGHNITEFHTDQSVIRHLLQRLRQDEPLIGEPAKVRCKDGSIRAIEISGGTYREHGHFVYARLMTLPAMEGYQALDVHRRLAAIVESSEDAIISNDLQGTVLSWNQGAERLFGYTAEEIKNVSMLAVPGRENEMPDILARVAQGERVEHYETERHTKHGRLLTVALTVSPLHNAAGTVIGASSVARDITGPKRLSELQERLAAIVESSDDAIVSKDLNGIIQSWNTGAERLFGYTAEEVIGKSITIIIPADRLGEEPDILARLQRGERVDHFETIRKRKDGELLDISLTISPVKNADGRIIGASKVARNITKQKQQDRALREANQALRRSNADLQQFAYSASHDLQEPLRMISTYTELLEREFGAQLGPTGKEYLEYARDGALRMEQLLRDLRAYTQVSTSGQAPTKDVAADQALDNALANLRTAIHDSGASVTRTALPYVRMHEFELEQVFQNLIGNAIRYRSKAPPLIRIAARQDGGEWEFSVQDNGIGIDPQYKEQVFALFKRLHSSAEYPGTGMGLAICQRIIERAGGRIWVESQTGRGATFYFTIPRRIQ